MTLDQIVGPKGNKEFTDLITVMGCNVGSKFDLNKLQFNKIIIASDADVDGLFIRSLLMAFFFKIFPEIIKDGRLFIAEPPLYRIADKKDPFVINKEDYIQRYVKAVSKDYRLGYLMSSKDVELRYLNKDEWTSFLSETSSYVDDIVMLVDHYKVNSRLLEMIYEEFALMNIDYGTTPVATAIFNLNVQHLIDRIGTEFHEIEYDDERKFIIGVIDAKQQLIEIDETLIRKGLSTIKILQNWMAPEDGAIILKENRTGIEHKMSLLGILKMLKKYQPDILHRFKGLGENDEDDIRTTIMNPNTRTLIKVNITDIENDMKIFQVLRGSSPNDALARKTLMKDYKIPKELIDT